MPISLSCPECDRPIKVPDELAGRKVKCPGCKTAVAVPATKAAIKAARAEDEDEGAATKQAVRREAPRRPAPPTNNDDDRPRAKRRDDDEDDRPRGKRPRDDDEEDDRPRKRRPDSEDEDRPRRKGKKGQKSGKGLLIGLCIGGGALLIGGVVLTIILVSGGGGGDNNPGGKGGPLGGGPGGGAPAADPAIQGQLKALGVAYHDCNDALRKGPSSPDDLQKFCSNPAAIDSLRSGRIVFIYNVRLTDMVDGTVNTIIAYEKDVPTRGGPVLFGDASTRTLSADEFAKTTKATPR